MTAYETLADHYDVLTAGYPHELWLGRLESLARRHGLRPGARVLDAACGTGKSMLPLLRRGYDVRGCDLSPAMVRAAQTTLGSDVDVTVADMRALPRSLGPFALVTCINDAVNYLLADDDLAAACASVTRVLQPRGLFVFDVNTVAAYEGPFAATRVVERDGRFVCWSGSSPHRGDDGVVRAEAVVEVFARTSSDCWQRSSSRHEQRHWPRPAVEAALVSGGLEVVEAIGQQSGARLCGAPDERRFRKTVYVARRPAFARELDSEPEEVPVQILEP